LSGTQLPSDRIEVISRNKRSFFTSPQCKPKTTDSLPPAFDWRQKNIVTPIKNQGRCGSCWAHASAASIESVWAMRTGQIIDLSEQDIMNCASKNACNGDIIDNAYNFAIKSGVAQESAFPYKGAVSFSMREYKT
jgi:C1A family cysteine protease